MRLISLAAVALLCVGCGTVLNFVPTRESPQPPRVRSADEVEVFMAGEPNRPYVEIGMVESQQQSASLDNEQAIIGKMRAYAGKQGCDGLRIFAGNDASEVHSSSSGTWSSTRKGYRGACLVYTGPPPTTASASTAAGSCMPNATQLCYGPGGCRGGQSCAADGQSFTPCDCGPAR